VEIATASATPNAAPSPVDSARSSRNSPSGLAIESSCSTTKAATESARTAPVTSLSADSATIVCLTFGLTRRRSKSGIRMAGSVGARTAPIRRPTANGTSKARAATAPVASAVTTTPGIASSPSPRATGRRTLTKRPRPPWKRMNETPSVRRS
jgi:hypothetical protein